MTEFAACRRGNLCKQCRAGRTTPVEHPWQKWTDDKRENVLNRMAKALAKHVEYGVDTRTQKLTTINTYAILPLAKLLESRLETNISRSQFNGAAGTWPNGGRWKDTVEEKKDAPIIINSIPYPGSQA